MLYIQSMNPKPHKKLVLPPVSSAAPGPLYQQIIDGVKREIGEDRLGPGDALPSYRALAEELLVSLITVKRAYEELERDGIIYRKQGLGTFVSENGAARSREVKRAQAVTLLRDALREGAEAGLTDEELMDMVQQIMNKQGEQK